MLTTWWKKFYDFNSNRVQRASLSAAIMLWNCLLHLHSFPGPLLFVVTSSSIVNIILGRNYPWTCPRRSPAGNIDAACSLNYARWIFQFSPFPPARCKKCNFDFYDFPDTEKFGVHYELSKAARSCNASRLSSQKRNSVKRTFHGYEKWQKNAKIKITNRLKLIRKATLKNDGKMLPLAIEMYHKQSAHQSRHNRDGFLFSSFCVLLLLMNHQMAECLRRLKRNLILLVGKVLMSQ